ncbi:MULTISPECIES: bifunctional UDP-N-acetylglucosamine diphosphorylase/glucosamine-1-phosphate N-acetyltransferase GlmU [unclassified Curtobacterium]|jgi:bifunctional UDP-N-acetylglucosamine pyrophosphorylase/glucosamine-1-phosphate N-acetyltransferase|uniref:bifunctional UDP-N-acetylglucosamine diphosphorylase/glucosamine-1-phosphate N-acetyltransferase GlmU n=1 Tax=unclassified Curtobacterium TaxID=257496 RepID=UPI001AE81BE9|nr:MULTISPECIES: bifunctional UDP-N-acetylglucosamine diphosphorylase/glucosamine-1-phosphate N-acetyltransferase GlmU [unclassified Curtobacterium]MBP1301108.1 bifunctional UDP-N-acetylglucosamine pyrophosphorylase/glucosamine-1-phosphate N-acetyltransferase [Curtobacterium sp. 1310]MCM3505781.1 bifunctional UDP-N-acetylglucosamine diphosphorylase/glucosamine-1-phosphate N-acetyltransferase GlmU [Curtobacterium sp. ODYSSEY 48 V2]MDB6426914.1 bifunctional UDP-N-acetylglucosamine diphosphorylase/
MTDQRIAVVVLAAGQGTRMKSSTPKVLHRLAGLPLLAHVLRTASSIEPEHVAVVVRHERERVAAEVAERAPGAIVVDQDEVPGTGRAVEVAVQALPADFDGSVVVLSGDVPLLDTASLRRLVDAHAGNAVTLVSAIAPDPTGLGRVVRDAAGAFVRVVEHKDATEAERAITEANAGIYAFDVTHLRAVLPSLTTANAQGEKYVTDVPSLVAARGGAIDVVTLTDPWLVAGINDRAQLADAARELNARIVRRHQLAGVTVQDPATTWIDVDVTVEADAEILPGTQLVGATAIAAGAVVGPDTTLRDTEVGAGAVVNRVDATLAVIGDGATVGPFAYLRPGTVLGEHGKIGTFVETKNAVIGRGSKVPHLSYIGDAEVGEDSNIGANTITANYDGVHKHRTEVGSNVRTGSHNVFVAPVRIGDGAYTGAGTTVRKDVPAGSLAISYAPQRNTDGWVEEHRPGSPAAEAARRAHGEQI